MAAGQQVPLDDGAPGAVVRVLQEQERLLRAFFCCRFFFRSSSSTPLRRPDEHSGVGGRDRGWGQVKEAHRRRSNFPLRRRLVGLCLLEW